jgi:hypothetical protein
MSPKQRATGKGKQSQLNHTFGPASEDYEKHIPVGWSQQIMPNSTVVPKLTIDVRNQVAKIWQSKFVAYLSDCYIFLRRHPMP